MNIVFTDRACQGYYRFLSAVLATVGVAAVILVVTFISGLVLLESSAPRAYVYEAMVSNLKGECQLTDKQISDGEHSAYVYSYGKVSDVWDWYQRTKKKCGLM
jgi:hypothetical protein